MRQEKGKGCGKGGGTGTFTAFSEHSWGESGTWLTMSKVAFGYRGHLGPVCTPFRETWRWWPSGVLGG